MARCFPIPSRLKESTVHVKDFPVLPNLNNTGQGVKKLTDMKDIPFPSIVEDWSREQRQTIMALSRRQDSDSRCLSLQIVRDVLKDC